MGQLKSGTTIAGYLAWHAGNDAHLASLINLSGNDLQLQHLDGTVLDTVDLASYITAHVDITPGSDVGALTGANVISQLTLDDDGHVTLTATRAITVGDIGAAPAAGNSSIVTVGTIASGTWQGTAIAAGYMASHTPASHAMTAHTGSITAASITDVDAFSQSGTYPSLRAQATTYGDVGAAPAAGNSSIVTVGTITSGTWQGTTIAVNQGGTGATSIPTWNQSTTGTAAKATILETARTINGVSFNGSANITITAVADAHSHDSHTGILSIAEGGTGASSIPTWNQNTTGTAAKVTINNGYSGTYSLTVNAGGVLYTDPDITFNGTTSVLAVTGGVTVGGTAVKLVGSAPTSHAMTAHSGSISSANITDVAAFSQSGTYASLRAQATTYGDVGAAPAAGNSSIVTVGTIGTGTWQGTAIAAGYMASHTPASHAMTAHTGSITSANITDVAAFSQSGTYASLRAQATTYGDVGAAPAAGNSSIVTVGTIGTGTWQGTAIASGYMASHTPASHALNSHTGTTTAGSITAGTFGSGDYYLTGDFNLHGTHRLKQSATGRSIDIWGDNYDLDIRIGQGTQNDATTYGFYWRYKGTGSGVDNGLQMWAENQAGSHINAWYMNQAGVMDFYVQPTINGSDIVTLTHLMNTYAGTITIDTVGTLTGGTWNAATIDSSYLDIAGIKTDIGTGAGKLVPAAGTAGHFLKHDGSFGVPAYTTTLTRGDITGTGVLSSGSGLTGGNYDGSSSPAAWAVTWGGTGSAETVSRSDHTHTVDSAPEWRQTLHWDFPGSHKNTFWTLPKFCKGNGATMTIARVGGIVGSGSATCEVWKSSTPGGVYTRVGTDSIALSDLGVEETWNDSTGVTAGYFKVKFSAANFIEGTLSVEIGHT
jgi:hypothetical protein